MVQLLEGAMDISKRHLEDFSDFPRPIFYNRALIVYHYLVMHHYIWLCTCLKQLAKKIQMTQAIEIIKNFIIKKSNYRFLRIQCTNEKLNAMMMFNIDLIWELFCGKYGDLIYNISEVKQTRQEISTTLKINTLLYLYSLFFKFKNNYFNFKER